MIWLVAMRIARVEALNIILGNLIEVDVGPLRNLAQVPQDVAHFLNDGVVIQILAVESIVLNQINDLPRFAG